MPHVIVKMFAGRSDEQKSQLAAEVTKAVMAATQCSEAAVSVHVEDVQPDRWDNDVYAPDITGHWDQLYKKPGYSPKAG
jgi:4-oxalocrotonate tautomerase